MKLINLLNGDVDYVKVYNNAIGFINSNVESLMKYFGFEIKMCFFCRESHYTLVDLNGLILLI